MSQAAQTIDPPKYEPGAGRSLWGDAARRIGRDPAAMICLGLIVVYAVIAIVAGITLPDWSKQVDYDNLNKVRLQQTTLCDRAGDRHQPLRHR